MTIRRAAALAALAALAATGCGEEEKSLPEACTLGVASIQDALDAAPARVAFRDGTRLSTCIDRARSDADLQTIGSLLTPVARDLGTKMPASDRAAVQLGYLIGAVRRGSKRTGGIHEELVRRIEQAPGLDGAPPRRRAAFDRGLAAGERKG